MASMVTGRTLFTNIHRYLGLLLAGFLILSGFTGSVIVFDPELDELLNPDLFRIDSPHMAPLPPGEIVSNVEASDSRIQAYYVALSSAPTKAAVVYVAARRDPATGETYDVPYDEVFIDPVTGELKGSRLWGECCFERRNFVPFMYKLHNRLLLPFEIGRPIWGVIAILWLFLIIIGAYLTLPASSPVLKRWRQAWTVHRGKSPRRTVLHLHRASGLWLWPLLSMLALTGVALGLEDQLFKPVVGSLSPFTESVWDEYSERGHVDSAMSETSFTDALNVAMEHARHKGITDEATYITYSDSRRLYRVGLGDHYAPGIGLTMVYVDAIDGTVADMVPANSGSASDIIVRASQPLHAGRIAGLAGRIAVFVAGLAVVFLAATGVVMWLLRRRQGKMVGKK